MTGYPDEPRPDGPRPLTPQELELAGRAVSAPAVFMILNGIFGLFVVGIFSVPLVFNPEGMLSAFKEAVAKQPPGPEKQDMEKKVAEFEDTVNQHRDEFVRQNAVMLSVLGVLNLVAIAGGVWMFTLTGYRMGMAGAVVSCIPVATGCCVTGIPFGLWALVVLVRPEVKAAFAARRNAPPPDPDAQYMR
jgi:hypothetical protein